MSNYEALCGLVFNTRREATHYVEKFMEAAVGRLGVTGVVANYKPATKNPENDQTLVAFVGPDASLNQVAYIFEIGYAAGGDFRRLVASEWEIKEGLRLGKTLDKICREGMDVHDRYLPHVPLSWTDCMFQVHAVYDMLKRRGEVV